MLLKTAALVLPLCGMGLAWQLAAPAAPDAAAVQNAYQREAASGDKRHDQGLHVREAKCSPDASNRYVCWITFVSDADANQRLYFDAVSLARENGRWTLKSGLCRS